MKIAWLVIGVAAALVPLLAIAQEKSGVKILKITPRGQDTSYRQCDKKGPCQVDVDVKVNPNDPSKCIVIPPDIVLAPKNKEDIVWKLKDGRFDPNNTNAVQIADNTDPEDSSVEGFHTKAQDTQTHTKTATTKNAKVYAYKISVQLMIQGAYQTCDFDPLIISRD